MILRQAGLASVQASLHDPSAMLRTGSRRDWPTSDAKCHLSSEQRTPRRGGTTKKLHHDRRLKSLLRTVVSFL